MAPLRPRCAPPLRHPAQPNVAMAAAMLTAEGRGAQGDGGVRVGARAKRPRGFLRTTTAPRHRCALRPSPATAPPSRSLSTCAANRSGGESMCPRPPAAGSLQPSAVGCGGAPPRRAPAVSPVGQRRAAAGRSAPGRGALRASPSRNPALALTAARAVLLSLIHRLCLRPDGAGNSGKRRSRAPPEDAQSRRTAAHCLDSLRPPAARPLPLRANEPTTTGPCPDLPLNPLTGQSSGYGLPIWCQRCFPQPGAGGSSSLRRRTCPPCRQAPSSRGISTFVLGALSSVTAVA